MTLKIASLFPLQARDGDLEKEFPDTKIKVHRPSTQKETSQAEALTVAALMMSTNSGWNKKEKRMRLKF